MAGHRVCYPGQALVVTGIYLEVDQVFVHLLKGLTLEVIRIGELGRSSL